MDIKTYLEIMVQKQASDLFFTTGAPVNMKIEGVTSPIGETAFPPGQVRKLAYDILSDAQKTKFEEELEMDMAHTEDKVGRFRINLFMQRGEVSMVIRYIKWEVPSLEELKLPKRLGQLAMEKRGLIIVCGATGSGKSTTLASMLDYRNSNTTGHILTLEDPIEFIFKHRKSIVNQREIGLDTKSYANGLRHAVREAPDAILIGEVRDQDTMKHAISYADTGHLCLTTLHATNAEQALQRVVNFFPENAREQLYMDLSLSLRAIIAQRLVVGVDGKLVPTLEILLNTASIRSSIRDGEINTIKEQLSKKINSELVSFEDDLIRLHKQGKISMEEAIANADLPGNVKLSIKLGGEGISSSSDDVF
ncbi:MAG: PilT/PilU family type 4a pilus ATPase [Sulfuriflexus sp.]|nr:PilT/PilU family type 4a pilus ATPase [Sulfuriflexus sp.]